MLHRNADSPLNSAKLWHNVLHNVPRNARTAMQVAMDERSWRLEPVVFSV
jgi:hypothetical protein